MANVTVDSAAIVASGNRVVIRDSNDRVYVFVNAGGNVRAYKGNVTGEPASFAEQDATGAPNDTDFAGVAAAIDSAGAVHVAYQFQDSTAHGGAPNVRYAVFRTSAHVTTQDEWVSIDEEISTLDNGDGAFGYSNLLGIVVDENDDPHAIWNDEITDMGNDLETVFYDNRIGGSWGGRIEVERAVAESATLTIGDIMVAEPRPPLTDRPIILVSGLDNSGFTTNAYHGTALNATVFTQSSDIVGAGGASIDFGRGGSWTIDSAGKITIAFIEDTNFDLMIVEHLASSDWDTWETKVIIDSAVDYNTPSVTTNGRSRYIFVEASADNDIDLWKNENAFDTFHFDGSDTAAEDADGVWTNETNADDGDVDTDATTTTTGSNGSNDLFIGGTNAPSSGGTIHNVSMRYWGHGGDVAEVINCQIHTDGQGESLGIQSIISGAEQWSVRFVLNVPTGGWTWAKIQALEATIWKSTGTGTAQFSICEVEVEHGLSANGGWVEETADADLPQVGTFNDVKVKFDSKNNNTPALLDYVFEDSGGAVLYNTFNSASGPTVVTVVHDTDSVLKQLNNEVDHDTDSVLKQIDNEIVHDTDSVLKQLDNEITHDTDSILKQLDNEITHDTDSVLKQLDNEIVHTTDSFLLRRVEITHDTDSVLKQLDNEITHDTDSILKQLDNEIVHTTDSVLVNVILLTHTTDSVLKKTDNLLTHDTDSVLKQLDNEITHDTDSTLKQLDNLVTHDTDSTLKQLDNEINHTTDSLLKAIEIRTHDTDSVLKKLDNLLTHTTDSLLNFVRLLTHDTDSTLKKLDNLITHTTDSILKKLDNEITHTTDSTLVARVELTHDTDSVLRQIDILLTHDTDSVLIQIDNEITHTTDSTLVARQILTHDTDSVLKKLDNLIVHNTDSILKKINNEITHTTDSFLKFIGILTHTTDSILLKITTLTHDTDSLLKKIGDIRTHDTDSVLKELDNTITHDTDSTLRQIDNVITHDTDSVLKEINNEITHSTDSFLILVVLKTHDTDSVLKKLDNLVTHTTDSFIGGGVTVVTKTHDTDSVLKKLDTLITHSTDSRLKTSGGGGVGGSGRTLDKPRTLDKG